LAFRSAPKPRAGEAEARVAAVAALRQNLLEDGNPWVAPEEARASNFMDLPDAPGEPVAQSVEPVAVDAAAAHVNRSVAEPVAEPDIGVLISALPLGSWVELFSNGQWMRTQLTWSSPHGTLFLFTNASGTTQSMTRRSCDKLVAAGNLRVVSGLPVVDGALNAVAQMALRNSVDTEF